MFSKNHLTTRHSFCEKGSYSAVPEGYIWNNNTFTSPSKTFCVRVCFKDLPTPGFVPDIQPHCGTKRHRSAGWPEGIKGESTHYKIIGPPGNFEAL